MGRRKRDEVVGHLEVTHVFRMPIMRSDYRAMLENGINVDDDEEVMEWFIDEYQNHLSYDEPYVKYNGNQEA